MRSSVSTFVCLLFVIFPIFVFAQRNERDSGRVKFGGGGPAPDIIDQITDEKRAEIERGLERNIAMLKADGTLAPESPQAVSLNWPVRKANFNDIFSEAISNYVDQNPVNPGAILDWNCGNRTYDQSGYNHRGIDIFTWPFSWFKMDNSQVEVVAAAAGTIIQRVDGNFDRNCSAVTDNPNMIFVRHSDGSVAWYLHMKQNSLTAKGVGATVAQGEFLGVIGSSGLSTGPHLHFELYNSTNQLQDPYQGACNSLNANSWWAVQEPYRNSRTNALLTHSAPPNFPSCPTQEVPNLQSVFAPGATMYLAAYYRDQLVNQRTVWELVRPNGTTFQTWNHDSPNTYNASYWYYQVTAPTTPLGTWKLRTTFQGQTVERPFVIGAPTSALVTLTGRVTTFGGRGITGATVTLTNSSTSVTRTALTNKNGTYTFANVAVGDSYTITASQRRNSFGNAVRSITPVENTTGLDIVAH